MSRGDRVILRTLQALLLMLPLARGGNHPWTVPLLAPVVAAMLLRTLYLRRTRAAAPAPGVAALAAFVALALCTTMPLPPSVLAWLDPAGAAQLPALLPGWPDAGGWSAWRSLAADPFAVWSELLRIGLAMGTFAVVVGYPWDGVEQRREARAQLLLALFAAGAALSAYGLAQILLGSSHNGGRASGPFVNPNHFAGWLEMIVPLAIGYLATLAGDTWRVLARQVETARGMGMQRRRIWIDAVVAQQERLWVPLLATVVTGSMVIAHLATGSRGGVAALAIGAGVTIAGIVLGTQRAGRWRWLPPALALVAVLGGVGAFGTWALQDDGGIDGVDVSLGARLAVARQGAAIVEAHPLFGTGLGSWLSSYRPYQAPPVEYGIWDHAHDDYLELAAETGLLGLALAALFVLGVLRAARTQPQTVITPRAFPGERGFGPPAWLKPLAEGPGLKWGLLGALTAILVHSLVDFSLRMPANLVLAGVLAALIATFPGAGLVPSRRDGDAPFAALTGLLMLAALPVLANQGLRLAGATPLAPRDCLEQADARRSEDDDPTRAIALARAAVDRAPTLREAHELFASLVEDGPTRLAALRRTVALQPWAPEARDRLAFALWEDGDRDAATAELEESVARFPYLDTHPFLLDDAGRGDVRAALRRLTDGDNPALRLAALDAPLADAVVRGMRRALTDGPPGALRGAIASDLVDALEARSAWADAATVLWAEAEPTATGAAKLARAANDYIQAGDRASAESALLAALRQNPDDGDLYRALAVDVYAAQNDFPTADRVLDAGQEHALDMLPVYLGVTQVIARRERARVDRAVVAEPAPLAFAAPTDGGRVRR